MPIPHLRVKSTARRALVVALIALSTSCSSPTAVRTGDVRIDLRSPDPVVVRYACATAVLTGRLDALPALIHNLRSEDMAIRMESYRALLLLLGQDPKQPHAFGYGWIDDEPLRERAVQRWEEWWRVRGADDVARELERRRGGGEAAPSDSGSSPGSPTPASGRGG